MKPIIPGIRRSERKPVTLSARCRKSSGLADTVILLDLTPEGCCICTRYIALRIGERITIRPESLEGMAGIVRWASHARAGIEFERPLYGPVCEHLQHKHSALRSVRTQPSASRRN